MTLTSHRRTRLGGAAAALCAVGLTGSAALASPPAGAQPPVPPNVALQCSVFQGPNQTWPHPLQNCVAAQARPARYTQREAPGLERIVFDQGFLAGSTLRLVNIQNTVLGPSPDCPADHPVKADVSGVISATEPGTKQYDGSPVSATICANATDFLLQPGTVFTVLKK